MNPAFDCPACGHTALTVEQKLTLGKRNPFACPHCTASLRLEMPALTGWGLLGWIFISLSGLLPLPWKLVPGLIGLALFIAPSVYLGRLVPILGEAPPKTEVPTWPITQFIGLLGIILLGGWMNHIPNTSTVMWSWGLAACAALPAAIILARHTDPSDKTAAGILLVYALSVAGFYTCFAEVLPGAWARLQGAPGQETARLEKKVHSHRLTRCSHTIQIRTENEDKTHRLCLGQASWESLPETGSVILETRHSHAGILVINVRAAPESP